MAKVDHYEIKRMNELLENYVEIIEEHTTDICFCSRCEFAKTEDDLTEVDEGELMYCKPCVDKCIENDDVDFCENCRNCFTIENLEEKNEKFYCDRCIDNIDTDSDEESGI